MRIAWTGLKAASIEMLRIYEWQFINPQEPMPEWLRYEKFKDSITLGWTSRKRMKRFLSGAQFLHELFRIASEAIVVRSTIQEAYLMRATYGTINPYHRSSYHRETYIGFDMDGKELEYDYVCGIIDTEILLRLNPRHATGKLLQGIIIYELYGDKQHEDTRDALKLAQDMLKGGLNNQNSSEDLILKGETCLKQIERILELEYSKDKKQIPKIITTGMKTEEVIRLLGVPDRRSGMIGGASLSGNRWQWKEFWTYNRPNARYLLTITGGDIEELKDGRGVVERVEEN